uniref:STAS domain-containing protein n=1 Tax=Globisporangium ultimum (strain ATCC 200006 / CBS 805.95 / DAOM BR144) TaxID=431595 RepID=K3XAZ1_GLOUD
MADASDSIHVVTTPTRHAPSSHLLQQPSSPVASALLAPSPRRMVFATPPLRRETSGASLQLPFASSVSSSPVPWSSSPMGRSVSETSELLPTSALPSPSYSPRSWSRLNGHGGNHHHPHAAHGGYLSAGYWKRQAHEAMQAVPCILIATLLNLMICVPFGLSFFPVEWQEMPVPRALGIQMFLLTTAICQFVFVAKSSFDCTVGMMMVENVPFMHTLSMSIIRELGASSASVMPTIMVTYALSSVVVGILFFVLGYFKLGNIIYMFPKHIIVGAIGGIGAFVLQNGVENATGQAFVWTWEGVKSLFKDDIVWLWVTSACLALSLSMLTRWFRSPLFPPLFFVSIPPLFYVALLVLGISPDIAREHGWFFDRAPNVEFYTIWEQFDFTLVDWGVIPKQTGTIVGLTVFSLMHVPINIPSLSLTTDKEVDINEELVAHGISNTLGGLCGSVQNYLCYSTSALYYKCGGGGRKSGLAIGFLMLYFFFIGPNAVSYVPRCMAGCLMIHIGLDLLKEALLDTYDELDVMELGTVWAIAACMTFWGMNQGLAVGALLACMTFVMQSASTPTNAPIRGSMSAATLRSNVWRTTEELDTLDQECRYIHVIQLKGHLFFGNVNTLSEYVRDLFENPKAGEIRTLVLDFTLVVGLDSSAADRLTKIKNVCDLHRCRVVFAAVPPVYTKFTTHLIEVFGDGDRFHVAPNLNAALEWCENGILRAHAAAFAFKKPILEDCAVGDDECVHLIRLQQLMPNQPLSVIHRLLDYFHIEEVDKDDVLWKQGDVADRALLLVDGQLQAIIEEEAGTTEDVAVGAVVGELCFLTGEKRKTTLVATQRSVVYVLDRASFDAMLEKDCFLAFLFQGIALRYTSSRMQYVGNRIWETKCVPI